MLKGLSTQTVHILADRQSPSFPSRSLRLPTPPAFLRRPIVRLTLALAVVCGLAAAGVAVAESTPGANLLKVRVGGDSHAARVVIELDKAASGKLVSAAEASKDVVLALPHVDTAGEMSGHV